MKYLIALLITVIILFVNVPQVICRCALNETNFTVPDNYYEVPEQRKDFPEEEEYFNNSIISNMFRQNGLNRKCMTDEKQQPDCALKLECRMYACFSRIDDPDLNEPLNYKNAFVLELYRYAVDVRVPWVAMTFAKNRSRPLKDAFKVVCQRTGNHEVTLYAYYVNGTNAEPEYIEDPSFVKLVSVIASTDRKYLKSHLYCKLHFAQKFNLTYPNGKTVHFDSSDLYYRVLSVGDICNKFKGEYLTMGGTTTCFPDLEQCLQPMPYFPDVVYREYLATTAAQAAFMCLHSCLAVVVFVVLVPVSMFPAQYHRFALNDVNEFWNIKEWLYIHLKYAIPVYPLLFLSVAFGRYAKYDNYPFVSSTNSTTFTHVHGNLGIICFQIYSVQFFFGLFSYSALLDKHNGFLKLCHKVMNYIGYFLATHILSSIRLADREGGSNNFYLVTCAFFVAFQLFVHFSMKFFDSFALQQYNITESQHYLEEVDLVGQIKRWTKPDHHDNVVDTFWEKPTNIQEPEFEKIYVFFEYLNLFGCSMFAIALIYYVGDYRRYKPASVMNTANYSSLRELTMDRGWLTLFEYIVDT